MQNVKYLTTLEEAKALSDPFRYKILNYFSRMNRPATVKQIADEMKEVPSKIYYHVKKLEKVGILKLVHTKEINGIIAKYYEPTAETFEFKLSEEYKELQENNTKLMVSEVQKMISKFYDTSKNEILTQLDISEQKSNKRKASISMQDLYLTKEEAEKFSKYVFNFIGEHTIKRPNDHGLKKYHCFFVAMEIKDDDDNDNK